MLSVSRMCPMARFSIASQSQLFRSPAAPHPAALRLVQQCSTKSAPEPVDQPKPSPDTAQATWNPIYHFPGIVLTASVKRLKLYPVGLTAATVPICLGLAYADIFNVTAAQICGCIGFTSTLTLLMFSYLTNNLVGYVYTDADCKQVRISYVDFHGKRQERIHSIDDIVPRSELRRSLLKFYFPIKNHDNRDVYRIVHKYGEIYNEQAFQKVFGRD
ncbi:transmembrane protein 186 [Ochlerotatus camptorhynchus]|uniref:transmembrane protein 186 n=1 Tax=Ochlerotatus camptorhynchus TaxID=644619 RepID=UPI0031E12D88